MLCSGKSRLRQYFCNLTTTIGPEIKDENDIIFFKVAKGAPASLATKRGSMNSSVIPAAYCAFTAPTISCVAVPFTLNQQVVGTCNALPTLITVHGISSAL